MTGNIRVAVAARNPGDAYAVQDALEGKAGIEVVALCHDLFQVASVGRVLAPDAMLIERAMTRPADFERQRASLAASGTMTIYLRSRHDKASVGRVAEIVNAPGLARRVVEQINAAREDKDAYPLSAPKSASGATGLILIGASTGGVDALCHILSAFPSDCPPTAIVQHTSERYHDNLVKLLNSFTAAYIVPAEDGAVLKPGQIAIAATPRHHLEVGRGEEFITRLTPAERSRGHIPSVDRLFASAVPFARSVVGVILTGMGEDGVAGLARLHQAGARTIGQDAGTSVVYGMPRAAKESGCVDVELPLDQIADAALSAAGYTNRRSL